MHVDRVVRTLHVVWYTPMSYYTGTVFVVVAFAVERFCAIVWNSKIDTNCESFFWLGVQKERKKKQSLVSAQNLSRSHICHVIHVQPTKPNKFHIRQIYLNAQNIY